MTSPLTDHILRRLTTTGADNSPWSLLILAALDGDGALTTYLAGTNTPPRPLADATTLAAELLVAGRGPLTALRAWQ